MLEFDLVCIPNWVDYKSAIISLQNLGQSLMQKCIVFERTGNIISTDELIYERSILEKFSRALRLKNIDIKIVNDTGYIETYEGHEEASVKLMKSYLEGNYPDEDIAEIESLILSTKHGIIPDGSLQEILHDADYVNLGTKKFCHRADLLRIEWERILQKTYTEMEWAQLQP